MPLRFRAGECVALLAGSAKVGCLVTVGSTQFDALIAAIAIANDLPPYTCNEDDFTGIPELRLRAIPHPGPHPGQRGAPPG